MKLEINYKKKTGKKIPNMWRLNNLILNDHELMKKSKEKLKITKRHEHSIHQNLWDTAKAVLREKYKAIQFYLKKQEKHQIDNLILHPKQLGQEEQNNHQN